MIQELDTGPLDTAIWRKATYSNPNNGCVGVSRPTTTAVGIRDEKNPDGGRLVVTSAAFAALLADVTA
jgi:hypothetical protein